MSANISIKKKPNAAPQVTERPKPRIRVQVSREHVNDAGNREEQILRDEETPIAIPDQEFTQPVANVGFQCSMTKNLGDFESIKVGISVHIPCYTHELDPTFGHAKSFVEDKLNNTMEEYLNDLQGGSAASTEDLASFDE